MADPSAVPDELRDPKTPDDVVVTLEAPAPITDTTLGVPLPRRDGEPGHHRLVSIGTPWLQAGGSRQAIRGCRQEASEAPLGRPDAG